jgi:hypothetical protein
MMMHSNICLYDSSVLSGFWGFWILAVLSHCSLLKAAPPEEPPGVLPLPQLQGGLPVAPMAMLANCVILPYWFWLLSLHFGGCPAFILCRNGSSLLSSSCSLLMMIHCAQHGLLRGRISISMLPPLVNLSHLNRLLPWGVEPVSSHLTLQLGGWPLNWILVGYTSSGEPSRCDVMILSHQVKTTFLLPIVREKYLVVAKGVTVAFLYCPIIAHGTPNPWVHCGHPRHPAQDEHRVIMMTNKQVHRWCCCPRISSVNAAFKTGKVSLDAICRMYGLVSSYPGIPTVMSGLATFTDAPVSVVMVRDFCLLASPECLGYHCSSLLTCWMCNKGEVWGGGEWWPLCLLGSVLYLILGS